MMKKLLCAILSLMLLLAPLCAFASPRMPELRGNINDSADVLSVQIAADLAEFGKRVTQKADIDLYVATVHFLDGTDVQVYADQLFAKWNLTEEDILLVGAAGEDSFAVSMGADVQSKLGKTNVDNLFYITSEFAAMFRSQQYDSAFALYALAFNNLLEKQTGNGVRTEGLFAEAVPEIPGESNQDMELWRDVMDSINQSSYDYRDSYSRSEREEDGLTAGGWLVLLILITIVLRQHKADRRGNKQGGCGCLSVVLAVVIVLAVLSAIL